jgi:hypothetical protein
MRKYEKLTLEARGLLNYTVSQLLFRTRFTLGASGIGPNSAHLSQFKPIFNAATFFEGVVAVFHARGRGSDPPHLCREEAIVKNSSR